MLTRRVFAGRLGFAATAAGMFSEMAFAQRAAHEGAVLARGIEDHFGEDRLVELDQRHAGGEQVKQF